MYFAVTIAMWWSMGLSYSLMEWLHELPVHVSLLLSLNKVQLVRLCSHVDCVHICGVLTRMLCLGIQDLLFHAVNQQPVEEFHAM